MPEFSVIIPLYNKERDIQKTVNSLLAQTLIDFEAIIVDDGSTDGSADVVQSITDPRIKLFKKKNEGVGPTRNYGVEKATAKHIVFLDADDYWYPFHLENITNILEKFPEAHWFAAAYNKKHNKNLTTPMITPILKKGNDWIGLVDDYFKNSLADALAWTSAVGMKKSFFETLHGFDTAITHGAGEDTDLWLRAALVAPLAFSTKISATHNLDGSNRISHTNTLKRRYIDLDKYEKQAQSNPYLKKYLDINRYSLAIQYKLAGDAATFKKYVTGIDKENLNAKQRNLLKQPKHILKALVKSKVLFEKFGFRLTAYK
ncbi:glycosyltransferase family 2 protein [Marixanthomonas spongiae]|uniref:Glycosyltransferase family 2 protein n=1 Tax=Marixanthomonas spongiae TaxID=2174845 RepID=A0A2U0I5A8_9FLAO|nr:glycosyltransferase family A protein [Marixanthomonas spongiae]PVW16293.1 glycosyltransferase family 2 protein [Marixanthomonas spongiae]